MILGGFVLMSADNLFSFWYASTCACNVLLGILQYQLFVSVSIIFFSCVISDSTVMPGIFRFPIIALFRLDTPLDGFFPIVPSNHISPKTGSDVGFSFT